MQRLPLRKIAVAYPHYSNRVVLASATALHFPTRPGSEISAGLIGDEGQPGSALCHNFNGAWAAAMDAWEAGQLDGFAMLHDDCAPAPHWLDPLAEQMYRVGADVISVVSPIKDDRNLTSTAVDDTGDEWRPRRLSMKEIARLPATFTSEHVGGPLLINTGCWLARLGSWGDAVCFRTHHKIHKQGGKRKPEFISEDWDFARQLHHLGLRVAATRHVRLQHHGEASWNNWDATWGKERDE